MEFTHSHYGDVIMTTIASQITSLTVVYSIVYSVADERKHQSSASLAFVGGIHRDRWIPRTKGQLRGKCFHLMSSLWSMAPGKCGWNFNRESLNAKIPLAAQISIHTEDWDCETIGTVKWYRYINTCRGWRAWNIRDREAVWVVMVVMHLV